MTTVYAFGCSYTAGQELCDEVIYPDYFRVLKTIQRKTRPKKEKDNELYWDANCAKKWFEYYQYAEFSRSPEKSAAEHKLAWPQKVGENLNVEVHNHGQYGAGMDTILKEIFQLLDTGEITFDTPIIIGLTNTYRYINMKGHRTTVLMWSTMPGQGWADAAPSELTMCLSYYTGLKWIRDNFKKVCIVRCTDAQIGHEPIWQSRILSCGVAPVKSLIQYTHDLFERGLVETNNLEHFFPGGHPRAHVHKQWADLITPYVKKDLGL